MRNYKYLFFLGFLAFAACKSDDKVPDDVISEERMPGIVAEVHIIDGDLYSVSQMPDTLYKYGMGHYLLAFKRYHTDTTQFKKSFAWYVKHPEKLDVIYDNVIKILQKKNDSIAKIIPPPPKPAPVPAAVPPPNLKNAVPNK